MGRTTGTEKLVAIGLIVVVAYFLWTGSGYPGGMPAAAVIVSPLPLQSFDIGQQIPVTWIYPGGIAVTAYRVQLGNQDFSSVLVDTGKTTGNATTTSITAPGVTGTQYIRIYYWDEKNVQSNPSKVQITITIADTPLFSITPDKSFTSSWAGSFFIDFTSNAPYDIEQIHIKLTDNKGIFSNFEVSCGPPYEGIYFREICLNRFTTHTLYFTQTPNTKVMSGDTQTFWCVVTIRPDAPAGSHTVIFTITFLASDSSVPPSLEIPWSVTIYA